MQRWARVTLSRTGGVNDGRDFWINESNVVSIMDLDDGCMICFATSEDDVITVEQSSDYIFTEWDEWQGIQEGSD
jgi:hypothetical protein